MATPSVPLFVSPKQVARAIGVSESSLKRWCDQGLIATSRTAGGHRKLFVGDVLRFIREHGYPLVAPEVLGLPAVSPAAHRGLTHAATTLTDALLAGEEQRARQIVFDLYLAQHPLSLIFDVAIAGAFHRIGELWACQEADTYQERRGCEIMHRILLELRRLLPPPATTLRALGGTLEGDFYVLPNLMAELVLLEAGYITHNLGNALPFHSLIRAVQQEQPRLFWLSMSYIREDLDFVTGFGSLWQACQQRGTALVVGGRALEAPLRQRLTYSAYCDTMQQLHAFAQTLLQGCAESAPA